MTSPPTECFRADCSETGAGATLLPQWRRTADRWRLTRGEAAALLRVPRATLIGITPRGNLVSATAARMVALIALDDALLTRTGSPAKVMRWIRFPSDTSPERRRMDMIAASDDFLKAVLRLLDGNRT